MSAGCHVPSLPAEMKAHALSAQEKEEEKLCRAVKRLHTTSGNTEISPSSSSEVHFCGFHPTWIPMTAMLCLLLNSPLPLSCAGDQHSCVLCRMMLAALSAKQQAMQVKLRRKQPSPASGAQRAAPGHLVACRSLTAAGRSRQQPSGASRA